jgi:hypothetical protein
LAHFQIVLMLQTCFDAKKIASVFGQGIVLTPDREPKYSWSKSISCMLSSLSPSTGGHGFAYTSVGWVFDLLITVSSKIYIYSKNIIGC